VHVSLLSALPRPPRCHRGASRAHLAPARRPAALAALALVAAAACANHARPAVTLYEAGDYAGAARAADAGLAAHPGDPGLWQMRVRAALAQGDGPGVARAYAAYRASRGGDDATLVRELAIATLGQALGSPSARLKIAAIVAVEAAELEQLSEQVAARMSDADDRVVAAAAVAVLRGFPGAPQVASEMLHSEEPQARQIAVDGIGKKVGKLAAADLERAAADPDPQVRRAAIRWLGELKDGDALGLLTQALSDRDDGVRAAAAGALARLGAGDLVALGTRALGDRALAVRLGGIAVLVAAHRPQARAALTALIDDLDPVVATQAALAAGGGPPAHKAIERAAIDAAWAVRAGAANLAVRALGKPGGLALARRLASDPEPAVRLAAARVLIAGGDRAAAVAIFAAVLASPDHDVDAAVDLASAEDPRGLAALDAAVRDPARAPTARAAAAAAHRAARHITPGLVAALADASGAVRVEAAAALALLARS
jgi:HEAT repeat protein